MFHDKRVVISHVTHLQQFQMQIPVVFHIGPKSLLIRSVSLDCQHAFSSASFLWETWKYTRADETIGQAKRLELLSDSKCTLNDVIRLKDIEEMHRLPPSNVHSDPGFIIKQYGCDAVLRFVSVNTDRIIEVSGKVFSPIQNLIVPRTWWIIVCDCRPWRPLKPNCWLDRLISNLGKNT